MDSSSKQTLLRLFLGIIEWRRKLALFHEEATIFWSESHVSVVYGYILKLGNINSVFKLVKKFPFGEHLYFSSEIVASFIQELQEFFIVPKLHHLHVKDQSNALKKHELLAAFIDFLLQLLSRKIDFVHRFEDRIGHLNKKLRFLVTILGDRSLRCEELEEVSNLLAEFESVANKAGSFVYSFIFTMDGVSMATRMVDAVASLLRYIKHLRDKITNLSFLLPYISKTDITAKTVNVNSLFIVDSLLHDLKDLMNRKNNLTIDVKARIKVLLQQLMLSQSFLKDIKMPRPLDMEESKGLVVQIRDLAYEAEYLVNSFLVGDVPQDYLIIRLPDIIHKIKLVGIELQEIEKNWNDREVLKVARDFNAQLSLQAKRNFEADDIQVGLEDETTHILGLLLGGTKHRQTITIFGMPGLGKTTLANKLYNHPTVDYYFDKRSWCMVSQTYQRRNLLIEIMMCLASETEKVKIPDMEEEHLGESIYKKLKGSRYFIVMDDVWDSNAWYDFRIYFPDDGNGSRILFTSRNRNVVPSKNTIYKLPTLSDDQCWELLQKKVFHDKRCPPQLLGIGMKIAQNCQGLPLAVIVVAGILSTMDKEESAWENVGGSLASYIFYEQNNSTMQILKLSYEHLPDHLKPCFLYFGAFPEDAKIPVRKLKRLWIVEGFIHKEGILKNAESIAEEYLKELIDRSLVIVAERRSDGGAKACVMHDLLRDLCLRIAEEENFLTLMDFNDSIYTKHLRLRIHNMRADLFASSEFFLPFGFHIRSLFGSRLESLLNFQNMRLLKLLDLPRNELHGDGSEHLIHLKYLAIQYMPASISSFVNLEYLIVMSARERLVSISSVIQKLVKLKYLSAPNAYFDKDSNSYQKNNLEFLSDVVIDKLEDEEMLKCSPHLLKLKCTFEKLILEKPGAYRCPNLIFLTQLESLKVRKFHIGTYMEILRTRAGMEINFPTNIKKLTLYDMSLPSETMSMIGGLPNLEVLKLDYGTFVGETWDTRDGEFQQLRFLKLREINISQWNVASREHFPRLQQLVLWFCTLLREIPSEIGEITTLQLIELRFCLKPLVESATKIQQEQEDMGNEELNVIIVDTLNF